MSKNVEDLEKITLKQNEAIKLILQGLNNEEIARKLKVNNNTVYRWRNQESFKSILSQKQEELMEEVFQKIKKLSLQSLKVLEELLVNADNENNKLKSAMFIIDKLFVIKDEKVLEKLDYIERLLIVRNDRK